MESTKGWSKQALYRRMLNLATGAILASVSACSTPARKPAGLIGECIPGQRCELMGTIRIDSLHDVSVDGSNGCVALAVPTSFSKHARAFDGRHATVIGKGYRQPAPSPGHISYYYEVDGMRVNTNFCDAIAIIAESIEFSSGRIWRNRTRSE